jgi:hypothetical protein
MAGLKELKSKDLSTAYAIMPVPSMNMVVSVATHFHHTLRPTLLDTVTISSVPSVILELWSLPFETLAKGILVLSIES